MKTAAAGSRSTARILRAALLFVFAAATILPFCSSFFMCAMPCCHRAASPQSALQAPMPTCPGSATEGCAPTISAAVDHTSATALAPTTSAIRLVVLSLAAFAPQSSRPTGSAGTPPLAAPESLHLLNSVFRI